MNRLALLQVLLLAAATAIAQFPPTIIKLPHSGANLTAGLNATVVIALVHPAALPPMVEIGMGVALLHCNTTTNLTCGADGSVGTILYAGRFDPRLRHANQTIPTYIIHPPIPSNFTKGAALLTVDRAYYNGSDPKFATQHMNISVNII